MMISRCMSRLASALYRGAMDWSRTNGSTLSAALAYYAALSLFPICLLVISGVGIWSHFSERFEDQQHKLVVAVAGEINPWLGEQLQVLLAEIKAKAVVAGPLGILSLLLAAITVFVQIDVSFDQIWSVPGAQATGLWGRLRTAVLERLGAFLWLLALLALLAILMSVNIFLAGVRAFVTNLSTGRTMWSILQALVTWGLNAVLFAALYKALPKSPVRWRTAASGGIFAATVWLAGQRLLETCVISDNYTAYGILGSFLAVMLWMYYASAVVLFGAMFVRNLDREQNDR